MAAMWTSWLVLESLTVLSNIFVVAGEIARIAYKLEYFYYFIFK